MNRIHAHFASLLREQPPKNAPAHLSLTLTVTQRDGTEVTYDLHDVDTSARYRPNAENRYTEEIPEYGAFDVEHGTDRAFEHISPYMPRRVFPVAEDHYLDLHIRGMMRPDERGAVWQMRIVEPLNEDWIEPLTPECTHQHKSDEKREKCREQRTAQGREAARIATKLAKAQS